MYILVYFRTRIPRHMLTYMCLCECATVSIAQLYYSAHTRCRLKSDPTPDSRCTLYVTIVSARPHSTITMYLLLFDTSYTCHNYYTISYIYRVCLYHYKIATYVTINVTPHTHVYTTATPPHILLLLRFLLHMTLSLRHPLHMLQALIHPLHMLQAL